jgi:beta-galactosidase/beta-glucuronidase
MSAISVPHTSLRLVLPCILLSNLMPAAQAGGGPSRESLSLAGQWKFQIDPQAKGEYEEWFQRELTQTTWLPGSMAENGLGEDVTIETKWTGGIKDRSWFTDPKYAEYRKPGNVKVPFWLTPVKHYIGVAWYQKQFIVPETWAAKRVTLFLERCHWETKVWMDGKYVGMRNSLSTPHEYDLGTLKPGPHELVIAVDNRVKIGVGADAHSVSDHTQGNWNGIIGAIELYATDAVRLADVQVYPDLGRKTAKVRVTIANAGKEEAKGTLRLAATSGNPSREHVVPEATTEFGVAAGETCCSGTSSRRTFIASRIPSAAQASQIAGPSCSACGKSARKGHSSPSTAARLFCGAPWNAAFSR